MKKLKIYYFFSFILAIGGVFAATWTFYSGMDDIQANVQANINEDEWEFSITPKALLQGDTVTLIYDELAYTPGDTYNGITIDKVDTIFLLLAVTVFNGTTRALVALV